MPFIPTSRCPIYFNTNYPAHQEFPCVHLSNEEIDLALQEMLNKGVTESEIPKSQYGRRVAVMYYLKGEASGYATP